MGRAVYGFNPKNFAIAQYEIKFLLVSFS